MLARIRFVACITLSVFLAPGWSRAAESPLPAALSDGHFTNELGREVHLSDFRGQALAVTFFYTRCPNPAFCPRLSKNFQEASARLAAMTNAPSNWHFLSLSFDPRSDKPEVLKAYAESYGYDPAHWSFLTGDPAEVGRLARAFGLTYSEDGGLINHNFRTVIVDATGRIQMVFPTGGNLSDQIADEMLKAAAAVRPVAPNQPNPK